MDEMVNKREVGIERGVPVVVVLHTPKEKSWGLLDEITPAGVFLRGLDLNSFDDWLRAVVHDEPFVGATHMFFPMWRVERVLRDESSGGVSSMYDQVKERTGRTLEELL